MTSTVQPYVLAVRLVVDRSRYAQSEEDGQHQYFTEVCSHSVDWCVTQQGVYGTVQVTEYVRFRVNEMATQFM